MQTCSLFLLLIPVYLTDIWTLLSTPSYFYIAVTNLCERYFSFSSYFSVIVLWLVHHLQYFSRIMYRCSLLIIIIIIIIMIMIRQFIRRHNMSLKSLQGTIHPVHAMNAEQRQTAVDPWTKPTDLSHWPPLRQLWNYIHHRRHYYSVQKLILILPSPRG